MKSRRYSDMLPVNRTREEARRFYDRISHCYSFVARTFEWKYTRRGLEQLSIREGERVLEIGFGSGEALVEIARLVGSKGKAHGLDISSGMLEVTKERLEKARLTDRVELQCTDATHLSYPNASFNAVFMSFTLELFELPEIFQVLGETRRVLKIDGKLGVVSLSKEEEGSLLRLYEWAHQKWPRYIDCRPIYTKELLVDAGFGIKSWQKMHMLGLPLDIVIAVSGKTGLHQ